MHDRATSTRPASPTLSTLIVGCIVLSAALTGCASTRQLPPCQLESVTYRSRSPDFTVTGDTEATLCGQYTFTSADHAAIIGKDANHEDMQAFVALFEDQSPEARAGIARCVAHWAKEDVTLSTFAGFIREYVCADK